ncbi:SAM-dependent methyltransferase [Citromicrobium sp. WPS32]|nr:SAM-dependent methyltransferase [Citromicrobium sp. WPS32]
MAVSAKRESPAAQRNREPIADVLADVLPERGIVLEMASGTGEHVVHFAKRFAHLDWYPSDPDAEARASIAAHVAQAGIANVMPPLALDAAASEWPLDAADAIVCINMVHISPWQATEGLFAGAARLLPPMDGPLFLYGPYLEREVETAPSNLAFDESLRARDPRWGLRDLANVDALAKRHGFTRTLRVAMPANNLIVVYRKA